MITVGCHAVIQKVGGEHIRICKLNKKQNILIEKLRFQIDGAFDQPFGLFEVIWKLEGHRCVVHWRFESGVDLRRSSKK